VPAAGVAPAADPGGYPHHHRRRGAAADLRPAADRVHAVPPAGPGGRAAMTATAYLQVAGLDHRFGGLRALQECSFTIAQGRVTCLVGPNGAGKTTIFNVITGFLQPDEGSVTFRGRTLSGLRPQAIVHAGIARTFQNLRLFTDLSTMDNVMIGIGS